MANDQHRANAEPEDEQPSPDRDMSEQPPDAADDSLPESASSPLPPGDASKPPLSQAAKPDASVAGAERPTGSELSDAQNQDAEPKSAQSGPLDPSRADIVAISRLVCPHLGLAHDRTVVAVAPTAAHVCYATKRRFRIDLPHQHSYCFSGRFHSCQYFPALEDEAASERFSLEPEPSDTRSNWFMWALGATVLFVLLALAVIYGGPYLPGLSALFPAQSEPVTAGAPQLSGTADVIGSAASPAPSATPIPENTLAPTADGSAPAGALTTTAEAAQTPVAGSTETQVLTFTPKQVDVGWWLSGDTRQRFIGDSFLYAGVQDQQAYVAAMRFDLSRIARGAPIEAGTLRLTGLRADWLEAPTGSSWLVQLLAEDTLSSLPSADFDAVANAPASITLSPVVEGTNVGVGLPNEWALDASARNWLYQQILDGATAVVVRIVPFAAQGNALFAWDSGHGTESNGAEPVLALRVGPPPPTPPPTATRPILIATFTPEPENVLTVVARAVEATVTAQNEGTVTPSSVAIVTPTPIPANLATVQAAAIAEGLPAVVLHTPVPANGATATADAAYATAVALTTGTFTPVPTGFVTPMLVYPSPPAENVATAAARSLAATAEAASGAPTATRPWNAVDAIYVYATPTPASAEEAIALIEAQNLNAATTGTPTPTPWNLVIITSVPEATPTPIPLIVPAGNITPTPTPTPTRIITNEDLTRFSGQILFLSDRSGQADTWVLDPNTGEVTALITDSRLYEQAREQYLAFSPDRRQRAVVLPGGSGELQVFVEDYEYNTRHQVTDLTNDQGVINYDPAWSPRGDRIAFVSNITFGDEIYTIGVDGQDLQRLTFNTWEWDKHPTWSPDGSQIVFFSNRDSGQRQIWIMNADGSNQRNLSPSQYNDWDPVWIP